MEVVRLRRREGIQARQRHTPIGLRAPVALVAWCLWELAQQ